MSWEREATGMRWGLDSEPGQRCVDRKQWCNASGDGVASKPAFRSAYKARRCLVPVSGFYEWQPAAEPKAPKQPYPLTAAAGGPLTFAGLWETWRGDDKVPGPVETFTIVTPDVNAEMAAIHDRMPVNLAQGDWTAWLDPGNPGAADLIRPAPAGTIKATPISTRVNSVRHEGPELIAPMKAA